jgi:hypothetical protein
MTFLLRELWLYLRERKRSGAGAPVARRLF